MPESMNNLIGGALTGFVGSKNKAREMAIQEEYKKAMTDHVKLQAKIDENKIKLESMKMGIMEPILKQAMGGGMSAAPQVAQAQQNPFAEYQQAQPQPGIAQAPQPIPMMIAKQQTSDLLNPTGGQAPPMGGGLVNVSPAGQKSYRFNNPFNVEYKPWQDKYGAVLGDDKRFGKYPSPEAGVAAATELIQKYAAQGHTLASAIERFAPTWENPNTPQRIRDTAKILGVSPNTPLANVPLGPFMATHVKYESPTQINPELWGEAGNLPIGQTIGKPSLQLGKVQQPQAQTPVLTAQTNPQQFQPIRTIDQNDAIAAAWKWMTGSELKDKKFDYRITKSGDIAVLQDGKLVNKIDGGPNISWHTLPNGGFIALDAKTQKPVGAIPIPEMVKSNVALPGGGKGQIWEPKGGGAGAGAAGGIPGLTMTEYPAHELPGTLPDSAKTKLADNNAIIDQLSILQSTFDKSYVGAPGMIGKASDAASGLPGASVLGLGDPKRRTWNQVYNEMLGQKLHARGGSALTKQEIAYVMNTLPLISHNEQLFKSGIEAAKMLIQASNYELMSAHLTPDKAKYEKAAKDLLNQYTNKFKPMMEQGIKATQAAPPGAAKNPLTYDKPTSDPLGIR